MTLAKTRFPSSRPSPLVFFEPEHGGHQLSYVRHLTEEWVQDCHIRSIVFAINDTLAARIRDTDWWMAASAAGASIVSIPPDVTTKCTSGHLVARAFACWSTMRTIMGECRAMHGVFLHLDHLQVPLAWPVWAMAPSSVSGLLFRPSVHYRQTLHTACTPKERLRDLRKRVAYRLMFRNPVLHRVFTFDHAFSDYARIKYPQGFKACAIPDPAPRISTHPPTPEATRILNAIPSGRVVFLLFGALARRKGLLQTLDALAVTPPPVIDRIAVVFAGRMADDIRAEVSQRVVHLRATKPHLAIQIRDAFIDDPTLASLIRNADVVLAPYQRFVGSSGVLVSAAAAHRPVITQDYGLVGALVRQYQLGIAIDTTDPSAISTSMSQMVVAADGPCPWPTDGMDSFVATQDARGFASALLNAPEPECS